MRQKVLRSFYWFSKVAIEAQSSLLLSVRSVVYQVFELAEKDMTTFPLIR